MGRPCSICNGENDECSHCIGTGKDTARIISQFMLENPQFSAVEWLEEYDDLTVYYKDNPNEPFCISEFVRYTPTWLLLEKLIGDLEECNEEDDEDGCQGIL